MIDDAGFDGPVSPRRITHQQRGEVDEQTAA